MKIRRAIIFLVSQLLLTAAFAQKPSARALFAQMFRTMDSVRTVFYQVQTSVTDGSNGKDSLLRSTALVWARRVPTDPVFGYYFHVQNSNKAETADYYYNGKEEIYIRHSSASADKEKTITVSAPARRVMATKEADALNALASFLPVLTQQNYTAEQASHLDSMQVYETEKSWTLQWEETDMKKEFMAQHQLVFDKKTLLITEIHRRSLWRGIPFRMDFIIQSLRFNEPFETETNWREKYADYRIEYAGRKD